MNQVYKGAEVLIGAKLERRDIRVSGGKFSEISPDINPNKDDVVHDVSGCVISPGFVDIHVHGGGGADFMDGESSVAEVCRTHAKYGTTAIFPTSLTAPDEEIFSFFENIGRAQKSDNWTGARIMGVNVEGPWLQPEKAGAQPPNFLKNPTIAHAQKFFDEAEKRGVRIALITAAPEIEGALELAKFVKERSPHTLMSMGHSSADIAQVRNAMKAGYSHLTHFYSAMNGTTRNANGFRVAGMVEAGYLYDELSVEVIGDNCHLPLEIVALIHKVKGISKMALITDAMRAAGMPEGEYMLGSAGSGLAAIVEDGVAKLKGSQVFAGSVCTMDRSVRTAVRAGIPLADALYMASTTPAELTHCADICGKIMLGRDADMAILDKDLNVKMTLIGGK